MDRTGPSHAARCSPKLAASLRRGTLWLLLLAQLAIPSSYYLLREDREDERFAWRMFSSLRFRSCQVQVFEQEDGLERMLTLPRELHASWISALRRGRKRVIDRFLESRCARPGVDGARLVRHCRELDGTPLSAQRSVYRCPSPRQMHEGEGP